MENPAEWGHQGAVMQSSDMFLVDDFAGESARVEIYPFIPPAIS